MKSSHFAKFEAFLWMLQSLAPQYRQSTPEQKAFIETTIGAALFYLPQSKDKHFTGKVSMGVVIGGRACKEHLYPRKWSAQQLLLDPPNDTQTLIALCDDMFLRYNHTTAQENKKLVPYQKTDVFTTPEEAYSQAGVLLT